MSFENEYIQKYGQRAVQAYKRSLKHSDIREKSPKPTLPKQKSRRSTSVSKKMSRNKKSSDPYLKKDKNSDRNYLRPKKSNDLSSLQLFIHPSKKKLVISDLSTPKQTPDKNISTKKKMNNLTTNVNVFVSAMNRSKSKQSTPCRDKTTKVKLKNSHSSQSIISQISTLLTHSLSKFQPKNIEKSLQLLRVLSTLQQKEEQKQIKHTKIIQKIKDMVNNERGGKKRITSPNQSEYVHQLQGEIQTFKKKEQSLLKIIESLSNKGRLGNNCRSSEEQDEDENDQ